MLVFIPTYDSQTSDNLAVVRDILPNNATQLVAEQATRDALMQRIHQTEVLYAMSHGSSDALWESSNSIALNLADAQTFRRKKVFVYACFTANELGEAFKDEGAIYWGYTGKVMSPSSQADKIAIFQPIFSEIINLFPIQTSEGDIISLLNRIKNLCDNASYQMDQIDPLDTDSYRALQDIWSRLRVKHFNYAQTFAHPEAEIGDLLEF